MKYLLTIVLLSISSLSKAAWILESDGAWTTPEVTGQKATLTVDLNSNGRIDIWVSMNIGKCGKNEGKNLSSTVQINKKTFVVTAFCAGGLLTFSPTLNNDTNAHSVVADLYTKSAMVFLPFEGGTPLVFYTDKAEGVEF